MSDLETSMRTANMLAPQNGLSLKGSSRADLNGLWKTAMDFEAQFLGRMLEPMFDGIETDGPMGGGFAEGMWRSQLVDEYGKALAKAGGIGLASHVMTELLRMQEKAGGGLK